MFMGYPEASKKKLNRYQKLEFKKIKKGFKRIHVPKIKAEFKAGKLEDIEQDKWTLLFYDFSTELLQELDQQTYIFFMGSEYSWMDWQNNMNFKDSGLLGFMGAQSVKLLYSSSFAEALGYNIYPFAFLGLREVLQNMTMYVQEENSVNEKNEIFFDKRVLNKNGKTPSYTLHDLDSLYTRVSVNIAEFTKIFLTYFETIENQAFEAKN